MSSFENPLAPRARPDGFGAHVARIKAWTRRALSLDEGVVLSVNEPACHLPGCPPKEVVVLVLTEGGPASKLTVHKALLQTTERDIREAAATVELLQRRP